MLVCNIGLQHGSSMCSLDLRSGSMLDGLLCQSLAPSLCIGYSAETNILAVLASNRASDCGSGVRCADLGACALDSQPKEDGTSVLKYSPYLYSSDGRALLE